ncbi:MAG: peptide deformylase [Chloroflexi bacterium]|nr:peptide deformylase [Chloroflexota bacterium]
MAVRRVVTLFDADHGVLRQKARRIKRFGPELAALADDMVETMRAANGVGLAAPQIGLPIRMFVAEIPKDDEDPQSGKVFVMVNPKIIKASRQEVKGEEGCLSIPGIYGEVWRAEEVVVRAQDPYGKEIRIRAKGYLARVFQHEIDHLEGILFIDRLEDPKALWTYAERDGEWVTEPVDLDPVYFRPLPTLVRQM